MEIKMEKCRLRQERVPMTLANALAWASEHIAGADAWVLAEATEKIISERWIGKAPALGHCIRLRIFNESRELALELPYGAAQGAARLLYPDPSAEETLARLTCYVLRDGKNVLRYAEHFQRGSDGAWRLTYGRMCGVVAGKERA